MSNSSGKRILGNFTALGIVQGTNFILPLVVIPYVIKVIGADGFGVVAIAQVVMMFFSNIADYGFNLTATRDVSLNKDHRNIISKIFFTVLVTRLLICAALFVLLVLGILFVPMLQEYPRLYLLAFATVLGQSILMNWLFQGIERMKLIMYISLFARLVFVMLVFLFIKTKEDKDYFIFFTGLGNILAGLISIVVAFFLIRIKIIMPSFAEIKKELVGGWHITVSSLSASIYMYTNVVILRLFTTDAMVGYYSVAEKVILAARQLLIVYFQVIYPQVVQLALKSKQELYIFLKKYFVSFALAVSIGCLVLLLFPQFIIGIFLHVNQEVPAQYLRIMSFVPLIVCLNIPAYQVLIAHNEKKVLLRIFAAGGIINILLNLLLAKKFGALGTSYVVLFTELLITGALVIAVNGNAKTKPLKYII